jgi:hypothetical protein
MIEYFLAFFGMLGVDFLYAEYTKGCADRRTLYASFMAAAMLGLNALVVTLYVSNPWTVAAAVGGAFAGTFISLRWLK